MKLLKTSTVLPGFGLALGFTIFWLSLIVLIPLSSVFIKTLDLTWAQFWSTVTAPRVLASYQLSLGASLLAALVNVLMGLIVAWVLVRYRFPGKKIVDALIDLPFALPTAVAGITMASIYAANGSVGSLLAPYGIKIAYTQIGIVIALIFIGLPFVVRTIQPVLEELEGEVEEAAASLGANRWQTFIRVLLPSLTPAMLTGLSLVFARAVGEYGSVIFIAGNMPMKTEIAPLMIVTKLEQYEYAEATAVALVLLIISFVLLLFINVLQWWSGNRHVRK